MGDVIHFLPAITDLIAAHPNATVDWVVEPAFSEIPHMHGAINRILPCAFRKWRKHPWQTRKEWQSFLRELRSTHYDIILDAQGLVKSAVIAWLVHGKTIGLDFASARESLASLLYRKKCTVLFKQHAVIRGRQLMAAACDYALPQTPPDFGIDSEKLPSLSGNNDPYLVFLHGTTWPTKHWPDAYWSKLAALAIAAGYRVLLPFGNKTEDERAQAVARDTSAVVLPKSDLRTLAAYLANAQGVVGVDSGLTHLAAALETPVVSLYGPTNAEFTGAIGPKSVHLSAEFPCAPCLSRNCTYPKPHEVEPPCFGTLPPLTVWKMLEVLMEKSQHI